MDKTFLIIADDFTGANDSGVQIAKHGIRTRVVLDEKGIRGDGSSYVLDTESRNMGAEDAYRKVRLQLEHIRDVDFDHVIKKVDSTLRGNIAREVLAADQVYGPDMIVFAPAFPEIGRTTVGGIHLLGGRPVSETEIALDPIKPVRVDGLEAILKPCFPEKIRVCGLEELRGDRIDFMGGRVFCFDIETPEDMAHMIGTVLEQQKRVLWVGSAGIAGGLLKQVIRLRPSLCAVGSVSEVSRRQVRACERAGMAVVKMDVEEILKGRPWQEYADQAASCLGEGKDTVVVTAYERSDYERAAAYGESLGMSGEAVSGFTQGALAKLMIHAGTRVKPGGIFLTGGDTAIGFISRSGAYGSTIKYEVMTGVPMMEINGGCFDGLNIITKAGAFGSDDTIVRCAEKLKEV